MLQGPSSEETSTDQWQSDPRYDLRCQHESMHATFLRLDRTSGRMDQLKPWNGRTIVGYMLEQKLTAYSRGSLPLRRGNRVRPGRLVYRPVPRLL